MNSNLLQSIGLGNLDIGIVLITLTVLLIIAIVLIIVNAVKIRKFTQKYDNFMKGRSAKSLENEITQIFEENRVMKEEITQSKREIKSIRRQMETTFQKLGLVKYNAFDQMGGNLSFCLVLLDENDNGFLLNSVHSTDSCYSYVKRIEEGKCKIELSNEESIAIKRAIDGIENEAEKNK